MTLETPLTNMPGIGAQRGAALARLGLHTAADVLRHYPRGYEDRTNLVKIRDVRPGEAVVISGLVAQPPKFSHIRRGLDLTKVAIVDETGQMNLTFFNQPYVKDALRLGATYLFYGKAEGEGLFCTMSNPSFEAEDKPRFLGRIMPVYALTRGISNNLLASLALRAMELADQLPERLPADLRKTHHLCDIGFATRQIHFPDQMEHQEAAARRLMFEELFYLSLGLAFLKGRRDDSVAPVLTQCNRADFAALLPFTLTGAQQRVIDEVVADVQSGKPMNRLVQGDVGSGKTAVAAAAAYFAWCSGYQSAMMAPTEILAEQHYRSLSKLLEPAGMRLCLLTGSVKAAEKRRIYAALASGEIDFAIGTHALITEAVQMKSLALVIADEQHRFGVNQRAALLAKGDSPHALVMSATPIPRTLALIIYGDLDVSVIDELPPGRTPVKTYLMRSNKRQDLYGFLDARIAEGRQVYFVCPVVEGNEETPLAAELQAVTTYAQQVGAALPHRRVAVIHGKLKGREKDAIMTAFAAGETDILVSTTVIEVGVDVANATVMVVENAERFGLGQLHQLRGRVGRGAQESQCFLVSDSNKAETRARLKILRDTTDGFLISEEDLKIRGPGDFFGARQHGLPTLHIADLAGDMRLLRAAQDAALALLAADPQLSKPGHEGILLQVQAMFGAQEGIFN